METKTVSTHIPTPVLTGSGSSDWFKPLSVPKTWQALR